MLTGYQAVRAFLRKSIPLGLFLAATVVALLLGELVLRLVFNPGDFLHVTIVDHPALGARIEPGAPGHDVLGFRNKELPERAEVVAIGDSMTYGFGAARDANWPSQMGNLLQKPVYNMALGGFGPLQYLYLAEHEASKLQPRLLLVGFYFGNDLKDAYIAVRRIPHWRSWREAGSADEGEIEYPGGSQFMPKKPFAGWRAWFSRNSVFYSVLRVTLLRPLIVWEKDRLALEAGPDQQMIWIDRSEPSFRTIFTPQLNLSALDPQLPSVQEGLRITKRAFASLKGLADAKGTRLLVVLIPTKERVHCPYLKDSGTRMPGTLVRLCEAEERVKEDLVHFLATGKIAYVDVTGALEQQIQKHVPMYPSDIDSHPNAAGYGVIARAVYDAVRSHQGDR
jgi:hypothetical protein